MGETANVWLQPLDGKRARTLTDFADVTMSTFDWSRDGTMLAWSRVNEVGDIVRVNFSVIASDSHEGAIWLRD